MQTDTTSLKVEEFIARWEKAEAAERSNYQMFLTELADLINAPRPDPSGADNLNNQYVFDRSICRFKPDGSHTNAFADLYKRGCFVLETKQGAIAEKDNANQLHLIDISPIKRKTGHGVRGTRQWDIALEKAYNQARSYIRDLPSEEGRPPFLIVCDVGYVIELYSEFTCTGGSYIRFPDPQSHRIYLEDLRDPAIRERLRTIWTDPLKLDPSKHTAKVTREVANHLATLAKSLEADGYPTETIAIFLQRCLFTMFAEDIGLLPEDCFIEKLKQLRDAPEGFAITLENLWRDMNSKNEWSVAVMQKIAYFNGGLFENPSALPCNAQQIALLIGAAKPDWSDVEPAIFGTLLERALSPGERHKLGAHYTPRAYVERLVKPTVIDPLRNRWDAIKTAAAQFQTEGANNKAIETVKDFHHELCKIKVLDPACGSGNFLYVTLEHIKRLEGEVLELLASLGDDELTFEMETFKVRPDQFYGLEVNDRAVAIAQLVLWIGYFQWHKKATGNADTKDRPLLPKQQTILRQDAVLAYDKQTPRKDADGNFVCIWDGHTTKPHPVTGKEVPDDRATIPVYDYTNPRRAEWPEADFIVGNPPFIGAARMREALGDGYTEALRKVWKKDVPESADFVMFWWEKAAELLRAGKINRFGFITTNSIHQTFNRRIVEKHLSAEKNPLTIVYAIPDHPWVDTVDGAAVRIAMTVATCEAGVGELNRVANETELEDGEYAVDLDLCIGKILANLKIGADLSAATALASNGKISCPGVKLHGSGFIVTPEEAKNFGLEKISGLEKHIRYYRNGSDITGKSRDVMVIDFLGLSNLEIQNLYPQIYQHLLSTVRPERDQNKRESYKKYWWIHGEPRSELRKALKNLPRYITTVETCKHRFFTFLDQSILPDNRLVNIALQDACSFSVLSSLIHVAWALGNGGQLGPTPVYSKTRCFETFPFPDLEGKESLKTQLSELGEQLDAHRKQQQEKHPDLTLTGIYNVLEKLRREESLSDKENKIHDDGLITLLKQIHDDIDTATAQSYGWDDLLKATPLADRIARGDEALEQEILTCLVALNHERAAEEAQGKIRWLRPKYQNPDFGKESQKQQQSELGIATDADTSTPLPILSTKQTWPNDLPTQVAAVRNLITTTGPDAGAIAVHFGKRTKKRLEAIQQILTTLDNLGQL